MLDFLKNKVFGKKSLNTQFIFLFLLGSLIPTLIVGVISYRVATRLVLNQKVNEVYNKLEKVQNDCSKKVNEKETLAIKFYIDDYVQSLLLHDEKDGEVYYQVMKLLFSNEYTDINDISFLCDKNGDIYTNSMISEDDAREILAHGIAALPEEETYIWFASEEVNNQHIIPFIRKINDLHNTANNDNGYIVTGIQEQLLHSIFNSYFENEPGNLYIINQEQKVISGTNPEQIGKKTTDFLENTRTHTNAYEEVRNNGETFYSITYKDTIMDWEYLFLLKKSDMIYYMRNIRNVPVIGTIISVIMSLIITVFATRVVTGPINDIISTIKKINGGNYGIRFQTKGSLEMRELKNFLNDMMDRLQQSMDKIYHVQKQRRDAEFKALVLQINPHFLYNTLSSITWLVQADQKESVIEMISSLATLFRISISRGNEIVTLKDELEHAKSYLKIQKIRFSNKFTYKIEVNEELLRCYTLKVILQPLIENSINHALTDMNEQGEITISVKQMDTDLLLSIKDNGNGMTEEEVQKLNEHLQNKTENSEFGIGTTNVNDRVRLLFGENYGLSYEKSGREIIAKVKIPMLFERKEVEKYQNGEEGRV